jgi:tetratricopeptide (TPR) repeat protein
VIAAILRATDTSLESARSAAGEEDRAMEWLGKADAAGYIDFAQMQRDDVFAALRNRQDFKRILAGLENKAIGAARAAVRAEPDSSERRDRLKALLHERAWLLATDADLSKRDPTQAVALAEEAIALVPRDPHCWHTLGAARYRAGDFEGAIAALLKFREFRNDDAEWSNPFFLAMAHWQLGHKDQARQWYAQGVKWMNSSGQTSESTMRFGQEAAQLLGVNGK